MLERLETKSCRACWAAKRRCSRQTPRCLRCRKRGVDCQYPSSKPSTFVLLDGEDPSSTEHQVALYNTPISIGSAVPSTGGSNRLYLASRSRFAAWHDQGARSFFASSWFTDSSTWQMIRWPQPDQLWSGDTQRVRLVVAPIYQWFVQWLQTGSSPFVHSELYRYRFPQCTQDAFSTVAAYIQRTTENTTFVLRLVESRATQLLADYDIVPLEGPQHSRSGKSPPELTNPDIDTHTHLSRVHALTLYQLLSLFSPSPDLHRQGEARMPVLVDWIQQLVARCRSHLPIGEDSLYPLHPTPRPPPEEQQENKLWHTWIQAESARRAFLVGTTVQSFYILLRDGVDTAAGDGKQLIPGGCVGGMPFTTRQGAWQASSHGDWEQLAVNVDFGLRYLDCAFLSAMLKGETKEWEVDTFAKVFLEGTFGKLNYR